MQHVLIHFEHGIKDVLPFSEAVQRIRVMLASTGAGEYVEDDMAIDGGDAEAFLCGPNAELLFETISPVLSELAFMRDAKITLVYGPLNSSAPETIFRFRRDRP